MSKQARRRRTEETRPKPRAQERKLPAWVLPVVVLLIAFAVIALALVANQSPTR
jgi:cytochrome c-type biogenesis protein CcmH/NrfF